MIGFMWEQRDLVVYWNQYNFLDRVDVVVNIRLPSVTRLTKQDEVSAAFSVGLGCHRTDIP